jgi:hypothetical protein
MHISPLASKCGGGTLPINSFSLILAGRSACSCAFGCVFMTAARLGGGVNVGFVMPDTTEAVELEWGVAVVKEAVEPRDPERVRVTGPFFGYASW